MVEVFQDAQAISEEIKYNQEQIQDIINQNTEQITGRTPFPPICSFCKISLQIIRVLYPHLGVFMGNLLEGVGICQIM